MKYKCNVNLIHPFGLVSAETTSFKILLGVLKQFSPAYVRISLAKLFHCSRIQITTERLNGVK